VDVVRFGVGHRRPQGPRGSRNVQGQVITAAPTGLISELAFARGGAIEPHANPNPTWFVVIEGGGFVRVGPEQSRVAAGEAVFWPPNIPHAAWTEQGHMRAIVVEFGADVERVIEGVGRALPAGEPARDRAAGRLAPAKDSRYDPQEGEPF
jgi:quercetin dioxygenase-like cupin family protein